MRSDTLVMGANRRQFPQTPPPHSSLSCTQQLATRTLAPIAQMDDGPDSESAARTWHATKPPSNRSNQSDGLLGVNWWN